jgi:hypothetical protein
MGEVGEITNEVGYHLLSCLFMTYLPTQKKIDIKILDISFKYGHKFN